MKRSFYFGAGIALGVAATRRTRRAKEEARAALAARLTPSAVAADVADAIAEFGNAVGSFAADVRQGAQNRRAQYRPMIDGATGSVALLAPDQMGPATAAEALPGQPVLTAEPVPADAPFVITSEPAYPPPALTGRARRRAAGRARRTA